MNKSLKIFTDFDATISINDVSDTMFSIYAIADWKKPIQDWKDGKISSKEVFIRECEMTRITKKQLHDFCDNQSIDPYFKEFVHFCQQNKFPISILSDGLDYYINHILKSNGLDFIPVYSNKIIFENSNRIRPEFPYYGKGCPNCANCKGYHIKEDRKNGEVIVYIGDGYSDRCGVEQSDIIFAKDDLKKHCIQENITFFEFETFKDVLNKLKEIS